jgi:hypothetical protein
LDPETVKEAEIVRCKVLGPVEEITPSKPKMISGEFQGGILFERSKRSINVDGCPRSYPLGTSYELQAKLHAPAPGNKAGRHDQQNLLLRSQLIKV